MSKVETMCLYRNSFPNWKKQHEIQQNMGGPTYLVAQFHNCCAQRNTNELLELTREWFAHVTGILTGTLRYWSFYWQARSAPPELLHDLDGTEWVQNILCECAALQNVIRFWLIEHLTIWVWNKECITNGKGTATACLWMTCYSLT